MGEASTELSDQMPLADELLEQRQARALIDSMLESMQLELRTVFVLFEMEDLTTAEIAARLFVEPVTVRTHIAAILRKLRVPDRRAAVELLKS